MGKGRICNSNESMFCASYCCRDVDAAHSKSGSQTSISESKASAKPNIVLLYIRVISLMDRDNVWKAISLSFYIYQHSITIDLRYCRIISRTTAQLSLCNNDTHLSLYSPYKTPDFYCYTENAAQI